MRSMLNPNQGLERGLLRVFTIIIGLRLLLWLQSRFADPARWLPDFLTQSPQTLVITALLDGLLLIVLFWPALRSKISSRQFAWLLIFSSAVLFFGHASLVAVRGTEGVQQLTISFTPYSMLLALNILFVAWQFDLRAVLLYFIAVLGSLFLLFGQFGFLNMGGFTASLLAVTFFTTLFTMLLPGLLIAHLMTQQRQQRAALAAAAEEQARTNEQLVHYAASLEELTISRERNRLARELHDTLAHSLSAVTVQLGAVETLWESKPDAAKALLTQADASARDGLDEARRALQALRASPLEDLGLVLALETLTKEAAARSGATPHLDMPQGGLTFLEPYIEQSVYRVAQEALENCVRHARAKTLWVRLMKSDSQLRLCIKDDGCGFDQSRSAPSGHYGVAGMKERALVVGGRLQVESSPGEGTQVQLVVPLTMGEETES
ncbi:MAG: sensor histidine kinase [Chloroflexota bacterium]